MGEDPPADRQPGGPRPASGRRDRRRPGALPERELPICGARRAALRRRPEQGFVNGRRFAHPVMRIAFEAPEGFTLTNSPQAILIEGPEGLRGEFAGGPMPAGGLKPIHRRFLGNCLASRPSQSATARPVPVNGVPALFVPRALPTPEGEVELSLAAYAGAGGRPITSSWSPRPPRQAGARSASCWLRSGCSATRRPAASGREHPRGHGGPGRDTPDDGRTDGERPSARPLPDDQRARRGQTLRQGERVKIVTFAR